MYAERSRRVRAERVPNDPLFAQQFYLSRRRHDRCARRWDVTSARRAIVVAVLDTGSTTHADLAGRLLPGYDFGRHTSLSNDGNAKDPGQLSRRRCVRSRRLGERCEDIAGPLAERSARCATARGTAPR